VAVGTRGTPGSVTFDELQAAGIGLIIANAYHLHLRPGADQIEEMGGLHSFANWDGPLMTDSGGFQVFSLGAGRDHGVGKVAPVFPGHRVASADLDSKRHRLATIDEEGVRFKSHLDGSVHRFTPEGVISLQQKLGADLILPLDECTSPLHDHAYTRAATERTHRWMLRSLEQWERTGTVGQALLGIVQGGSFQDLREESARFMAAQGLCGYAIGGSLGRNKEDMHRVLDWTVPLLPSDRPRHLLGIGEIEDLFEGVGRGVDLFDAVTPTRMAATGTVLVKGAPRFRIHLTNARFKDDGRPIEDECLCPTCRRYSRAYLRHLFVAHEILGVHLATMHNLCFVGSLMDQIRGAIRRGGFAVLRRQWMGTP
jgi:queuine tRNA-ribosyltransferase/7-cyano-7-deazaguanine tRNA-ribosyltransferase